MRSKKIALPQQNGQEEILCTITISCKRPNPQGQMNVEMHYEGDDDLAQFLLEGALEQIEARV